MGCLLCSHGYLITAEHLWNRQSVFIKQIQKEWRRSAPGSLGLVALHTFQGRRGPGQTFLPGPQALEGWAGTGLRMQRSDTAGFPPQMGLLLRGSWWNWVPRVPTVSLSSPGEGPSSVVWGGVFLLPDTLTLCISRCQLSSLVDVQELLIG